MLAYKIPLAISAAVAGAFAMPVSTNQMLLVAQAIFDICVSFALFIVVLHAAEHRKQDPSDAARSAAGRARPRRH
jgi:hypothetical protein